MQRLWARPWLPQRAPTPPDAKLLLASGGGVLLLPGWSWGPTCLKPLPLWLYISVHERKEGGGLNPRDYSLIRGGEV